MGCGAALQAPVFSPLIKPGKNAENADSVSQPPRVSVLLYPHIIREELTMASNLEQRAVRQWLATLAGVAGVGEGAAGYQRRLLCTSFKTHKVPDMDLQRKKKKIIGMATCTNRFERKSHTRVQRNKK